ncbi:hypothetical protein J6590_015968 [Homalodisca vitripennis]|nr:hypothetical protein J6590_015968 [Homalodisca vitripennis]
MICGSICEFRLDITRDQSHTNKPKKYVQSATYLSPLFGSVKWLKHRYDKRSSVSATAVNWTGPHRLTEGLGRRRHRWEARTQHRNTPSLNTRAARDEHSTTQDSLQVCRPLNAQIHTDARRERTSRAEHAHKPHARDQSSQLHSAHALFWTRRCDHGGGNWV